MSTSADDAASLVAELDGLAQALLSGVDANGDGRTGWQEGEGGLEVAQTHGNLMKQAEVSSGRRGAGGSGQGFALPAPALQDPEDALASDAPALMRIGVEVSPTACGRRSATPMWVIASSASPSMP